MKPIIRPAKAADLDSVMAIEAAWPAAAGWTRSQFADELERPGCGFLVAEQDGRVAGYGVFRPVATEAQILDVAVSPDCLRQGIGRALLEGILERAKNGGLKKATLEVRQENEAALALYRSAGFAVVGRRPKFYNPTSDAVLMDRDLA